MGFVKEFRDFALKGNVFDLAVGVIIGGAFGKIVSSLIDNILNPIIGKVAGGVDFTNNYLNISGKTIAEGAPYADAKKVGSVLGHGAFISDVINFLIMAFVVFLMVKMFNSMRAKWEKPAPAAAPAAKPAQEVLLEQILTELKRR